LPAPRIRTFINTHHNQKPKTPKTRRDEMFGGAAPLSKAELKEKEMEATQTVQTVVVGSILLYLSPFAIDFVRKLI